MQDSLLAIEHFWDSGAFPGGVFDLYYPHGAFSPPGACSQGRISTLQDMQQCASKGKDQEDCKQVNVDVNNDDFSFFF